MDSDGTCITDGVNDDITDPNPGLDNFLDSNGGPTLTHALLSGSPAIDAGDPNGCTDAGGNLLTRDQRGFLRPVDGVSGSAICDIGAYEFGSSPPNTPPVALCKDVEIEADEFCFASASVDDGSFDPDGDPITLEEDPPGPYGLGDTLVTLTVTDDQGASDSCTAMVTVEDLEPPEIQCNAPETITPPNAPISFTATASDNCGVSSVEITGYDCFFVNPAGKRVDKTESCVVEIDGDTM